MFNAQSIYLEQFEGRAGGRGNFLRLGQDPPKADVVLIAKTLGLQDAESHADALAAIARQRGRIRWLFEILQNAKDEAIFEEKPFTMAYVEWALEDAAPAESQKGKATS